MGLINRAVAAVWNLPRIFAAPRADPPDPSERLVYIGRSPAGIIVTPDEALKISAVWACCKVIAEAIAACRWEVIEEDTDGNRTVRRDVLLYRKLNVAPNPEMTAFAFRESALWQALLWGDFYAEIERSKRGDPMAIWPIDPGRVQLTRGNDWELFAEVSNSGGNVYIPYRDIFHLHGPSLTGLGGMSLIGYAARTFGHAAAAEIFGGAFYGNGTQLGGVLSTDGSLTEQQRTDLLRSINERHAGPDNAHKFLLLQGGLKFTPLSPTQEQSQFIETRGFLVEEICFVPGTRIVTPAGLVPIEKIRRGDLVLTHKGRWRRVRNTMQRSYVGQVVTVAAKGLDPVTSTPNHPFYVEKIKSSRSHRLPSAERPEWVAAGDLTPVAYNKSGDMSRRAFHCVTVPRMAAEGSARRFDMTAWAPFDAVASDDLVKFSRNHRATSVRRFVDTDYDLGWLVGIFAADGSATERQAIFYIGAHEPEVTRQLEERISRVFGVSFLTSISNGVARTVISNRIVARFFADCGKGQHVKRIPDWFSLCGDQFRDGLIDGLVDGDGCTYGNRTLVRTVSIDLAWQLRLLMWSKGINASLSTSNCETWEINGRGGVSRPIHTVEWRNDLKRRGTISVSEDRVSFQVRSADQSFYVGTVHNLEVEDDESYTTVGGCVHNCRWFSVPPHKIAHLVRSTFTNIEHQGLEFVRDTLTPWAERLRQEADLKLTSFGNRALRTRFDLAWLSEGDAASQADADSKYVSAGIRTRNEIRREHGWNALPEADGLTVQKQYVPLEEAARLAAAEADNAENPPRPVLSAPARDGDDETS